uniref:Cation/H+ exchanger transmembrane domain-containing protein n=1 Tax=Lactuca sativa TaxID=4236 RepID=A0A9R1UXU8_LACSA|nr:hypothetical protein LSAT_V11C700343770 [Lactuca sativa]
MEDAGAFTGKHWCRLSKRSSFRNHTATESIIPSSQDPCGDLLKWLLPLKNSIPSPSPSLTPLPSNEFFKHPFLIKKSQPFRHISIPYFSFGHFRSYSMSAIPPSDAPVLPSSSMSSIDLEDQNQFSSRKSKDEKGEGEGLLSFRGLCGAGLSDDVFVGCFLSMSSTAVVVKFLVKKNSNNALNGQINIILVMSFAVIFLGLEFIFLSSVLWGIRDGSKLKHETEVKKKCQWMLMTLSTNLFGASLLTWSFVPCFLNLMVQLSSQTNELYQLDAVAFCLLSAWCRDKLGLTLELGSFMAGTVIREEVAGGNGEQVTIEKVVLEQSNSQYELQGEYVLLENEAY